MKEGGHLEAVRVTIEEPEDRNLELGSDQLEEEPCRQVGLALA